MKNTIQSWVSSHRQEMRNWVSSGGPLRLVVHIVRLVSWLYLFESPGTLWIASVASAVGRDSWPGFTRRRPGKVPAKQPCPDFLRSM